MCSVFNLVVELSVVLMRSSLPVISSNVIHIYINLLEDVVLPFLFFFGKSALLVFNYIPVGCKCY